MSVVLGISAYHGDAAAALLIDGQLVAAAAEERFTRVKHAAGFPSESVRSCLDSAGLAARDVDHFAIGRDPRANRLAKMLFALRTRPSVGLVRDRASNGGRVRDVARAIAEALGVDRERVAGRLSFVEHHPAHLAAAFLASPFDEAAVCAIDGFGDFVSTSSAVGRGGAIRVLDRVRFPHSLGLVYLAITQHLGFTRYGDEYKVMALASYGEPDCADRLRRLIRLEPAGRFALDLAYFRHAAGGVRMTWDEGEPRIDTVYTPELLALLGPARDPGDPLGARHHAIAASLQLVFEETAVHVLRELHRRTGLRRLCLAGGCAQNSAFNGKIRSLTPFAELWVPPAAADDGAALGAALSTAHQRLGEPRGAGLDHASWGPCFDAKQVRDAVERRRPELRALGARVLELEDLDAVCRWTADRLARGEVAGWFQGRMEWGPRALGNRSILADPRRPEMREIVSSRIKRREAFRPLAPSILAEAVDRYFVGAAPDRFMTQVYPVRPEKRAAIPAVVHVDGTARLHAVPRDVASPFRRLLERFADATGAPVLLNTSFNESEPIVHTPDQALDCFLRTEMDALVLGQTSIARRSDRA
jgi:carbamoyltransferase